MNFHIPVSIALTLIAAMLSTGARSRAETLRMTDGSVIHGTILESTEKTVRIETGFAGVLTVDREHVQSIGEQGAAPASNPDEPEPVKNDEVSPWHCEMSADFSRESGNTDSMDFGAALRATYDASPYRAELELRTREEKNDGETTTSEIVGTAEIERFLNRRRSVFAHAMAEQDDEENLDLGLEIGGGCRYYLIRSDAPFHELSVSGALTGRREDYGEQGVQTDLGVEFQAQYAIALNSQSRFTSEASIQPTLDDPADYLIHHESTVEFNLFESDRLKLRTGYVIDYDSQPVDGVEHTDTRVFTEFVYIFN